MNETYKNHGDLERYVDGLMSSRERTAFEARVQKEPELARDLERQTQLERRLRSAHEPRADLEAVTRRVLEQASAATPARHASSSWRRRTAVAASVLLILAAAVWWHFPFGNGAGRSSSLDRLAAGPLYSEVAASPLAKPGCGLPSTLGQEVAERCEGAVACREESANIPVAVLPCSGWPTATVLFGRQEEQLVVIIIDALERDPAPRYAGDLNVHRRELADFVMYELTPLERPYFLTELYGCESE